MPCLFEAQYTNTDVSLLTPPWGCSGFTPTVSHLAKREHVRVPARAEWAGRGLSGACLAFAETEDLAWPCEVKQNMWRRMSLEKTHSLTAKSGAARWQTYSLVLDLRMMAWCQFYVAGILDFTGQTPNSGYFYYCFLFCLIQSLVL